MLIDFQFKFSPQFKHNNLSIGLDTQMNHKNANANAIGTNRAVWLIFRDVETWEYVQGWDAFENKNAHALQCSVTLLFVFHFFLCNINPETQKEEQNTE